MRLVALQNDDINLENLEAIQGTNCLTHFHDMNITHGGGEGGRQIMIEAHVDVNIPNSYLLHLLHDDFAFKKSKNWIGRHLDILHLALTDPQNLKENDGSHDPKKYK